MLFANNCNTTLNGGITAVATSMVVTSATGFPVPTGSQYFYCTLADAATQTTIEIVKVTAVSGTTFTIVRGQDGTTGTIFASGDVVSLRLVRASLNDFPKLDEANTFTSGDQSFAGNIVLSSTGQRITGDFSNGTVTNRVFFQANTTNANTSVGVIPNGTGVAPNFVAYNNSDPTNASRTRLTVNATESQLQADITGTGTYLPITMYTNGSERLRITTAGNLLLGTTTAQALFTAGALVDGTPATFGGTISVNSATQTTLAAIGGIELPVATGYSVKIQQISAGGAALVFGVRNSSATWTETMRMSAAGGLSIGNTTDPGAGNLSVAGTIASSSTITGTQYIVTTGILTSTTQGSFAVGTLGYSDTGQLATYQASTNGYIQTEIQNTSAGASASSDHIVGNNNTTATTYYGDFGMNSSGWAGVAGTNSFSAPNMVYLTSTTGDLAIGTTNANIVLFSINGGADIAQVTSTGLNSAPIGATTASTGSFTSLTATSVGTAGVLAKNGGLTSVTAVAGSLTLATGGVTLASQAMASTSTWRIRAYGTYVASSSATARTLTMRCYWGSTALTAVTTGNVLASTAQTTPWQVELEITGSSATAAWCTAVLMSQVTSATIPQQYVATAASVTGLTTTSTLDFRVGQTGTAVAGDTINVHSVTIERIV